MVSRIIYNGSRVSNMHLCVTIAFQDRLLSRRDDCHLTQSETPCPSLRIKAPNYIGMNKAPENLYCSSWASAIPLTCGIAAARFSGALFIPIDRKSTRLNSSHQIISYAVF